MTRQLLTASQTLQLGSKLRTRAAFNYSPTKTVGLLPALAGSDSPASNFDVTMGEPNWTVSGTADFAATPRLSLSGRVGYMYASRHNEGVRSVPCYTFAFSHIGLLAVAEQGVELRRDRPAGR